MCGIVGLLAKHGTFPYYVDTLFTHMLQMDSIRGPDSTGVFGVTKGGIVDSQKGNADGYLFTKSKQYQDFYKRIRDYSIVIGHNRKATVGKVTAENAHPFLVKHIIMVHNGTLRSTAGLKNTDVDSEAICHALADHDPVQALEKLNGAYALVWYDSADRTLNLARNSERPLSLIEYPTFWSISSEVGLPIWLNGRENRKPEKDGIRQVPEKKILCFKLDAIDKGPFEIPYEEYKSWKPPAWNSTTNYSGAPYGTGNFPHNSTPHTPVTLRSSTHGGVVSITTAKSNSSNQQLKAGETIVFELDDDKEENGASVLLGYPVFDGEKDENIVVRTVLKPGDDSLKYFGLGDNPYHNKLWKATIQHVRTLANVPTVYVQNMEPYLIVVDAQGEQNSKDEVAKALESGCTKCQKPVSIDEVEKTIVRKRNDGTWRIVCPSCLQAAMKEAEENRKGKNISVQ